MIFKIEKAEVIQSHLPLTIESTMDDHNRTKERSNVLCPLGWRLGTRDLRPAILLSVEEPDVIEGACYVQVRHVG